VIQIARRKGMGKGQGKGFKNIIPQKDSRTHSNSARGIKQPQRQKFDLLRVDYGRKETPLHLREYQLARGFPVGTLKEYEDAFKNKAKFNVPLTMAEKKRVTRDSGLRDTDGDGVGDIIDCRPLDPNKQDIKESLAKFGQKAKEIAQIGLIKGKELAIKGIEKAKELKAEHDERQRQKFQEQLKDIEQPLTIKQQTKEEGIRDIEGKIELRKKDISSKRKTQMELLEKKQEKLLDIQEKSSKKHPLKTQMVRQERRVHELKSQLASEDSDREIKKLEIELDKEQEQLRKIHERVTNLKVEDLTEAELKTLAVRNKDIGFFSGENKYEAELIRRIKREAEINRKTAEIRSDERIEMDKLDEKLKDERKKAKGTGGSLLDDLFSP